MCGAVIVILCFVLYFFCFFFYLFFSVNAIILAKAVVLKMLGNASRSMQPL